MNRVLTVRSRQQTWSQDVIVCGPSLLHCITVNMDNAGIECVADHVEEAEPGIDRPGGAIGHGGQVHLRPR